MSALPHWLLCKTSQHITCMQNRLPPGSRHLSCSAGFPEPPVHHLRHVCIQRNLQRCRATRFRRHSAHASSELADVWPPLLSNVSSAVVSVTTTLSKLPLYTSNAAMRFLMPEISASITVLRSSKLSPTHPETRDRLRERSRRWVNPSVADSRSAMARMIFPSGSRARLQKLARAMVRDEVTLRRT